MDWPFQLTPQTESTSKNIRFILLFREVLISSTLMLVLFSTIVFGALMPMFIKFFSSLDHEETNEVDNHYIELGELNQGVEFDYLHPNFSQE